MTVEDQQKPRRRTSASRKFGYLVAVLINAALYYLVNHNSGWRSFGFITAGFVDVVTLVNASIIANLVANVLFVIRDSRRIKAVSQALLMGLSAWVAVRLLAVFPFHFTGWFPWTGLLRVMLVIGIVAGVIGTITNLVLAGLLHRPFHRAGRA